MISCPSPAKLNLFLHIIGQREDGYHLLQSVIQFIDLYDELTFSASKNSEISCICSNEKISPTENLAIRVANALQQQCDVQKGINIQLKKQIPIGAGLGGASSNAATTLLVLNRVWECNLESSQLEELGAKLGADIPVFIRGVSSFVEGVGEKLIPISPREVWYVVLYPDIHLSTKEMFANENLTRSCVPLKIRDLENAVTENVFQPIALQQGEIEEAFQWLSQYSTARLTGSGSALFIACASEEEAREISSNCPNKFTAFAVKGMNRSPVHSLFEYN